MSAEEDQKPILIAGPTASGKSALAQALVARVNGVVINADASQVYRDLRILSARPSPEDEARVPHALFGFVDAAERYSAGRWLTDALGAIAAARARGRTPIVVGGTGLYFKALTEGLADIAPASAELRLRLARELAAHGAPALHARLAPEDAARIEPTDPARILRALEVLESTGAPIAALRRATTPALTDWIGVALTPERGGLYERIERRLDDMLAAGALEEAGALAARHLADDLPAMKAMGAAHFIAHLRGELPLARALGLAKRDTRRYAKRQFTWIAGQLESWSKIKPEAPEVRLGAVLALIEGVDGGLSAI
jgi:tRNA dimethylallyltransferase